MADHSAYHALAQPGYPNDDPRRRASQPQVAPPHFNPAVAPGPQGYHQAGPPHTDYGSGTLQSPYGGGPQDGAPPTTSGQEQGYFPQGVSGSQPQHVVGGITSQMGGLAVGENGTGSLRAPKKKQHRHAYHDLTPAGGSSQAFNGMPQSGLGDSTQFLDSTQGRAGVVAENAYAAQQNSGYEPYGATSGRAPSQGSSLPPADQTIQGSAQGKVDPEQIPSVPKSRDVPAQYYLDHVYPTMERHLPPPATIPFVAHDQGNSSPKFARLTLNNIPSTAESLSSTGLPLGLILQPLAPSQVGEQPVPLLDFGEPGPPRCRRCRTYINPFMTFRSGGNKLVCNMCTFPNEVAPEYFAPTDPSGIRVDRMQRPELMMGTVEFTVPKEYWAKEPVGLRWLFLIDVCQESVNRGLLEAFCEGIITALYSGDVDAEKDQTLDGDDETEQKRLPAGSKVGIVTYDKDMHFYNLSPNLGQAQMMVMTDLEDPFVPLSEGLFVDPYESKDVIKSLLTQLPSLFSRVKNPEPSLLSSLTAAVSALAATGGKIICSLSALPTWGPGRLFLRDDNTHHQSEAEKKLFKTEHPGYTRLATKMVESGIGVDFFLASAGGGYLDIATIGHLSGTSGGEVYYYPHFVAPRDTMKLSLELKHTLNRETGYQALMKVRCSNGLQVSSYHGSFTQHTFGADLEFGVIDEDKALGVLFNYDGKLDTKLDAHFQAALLYTTASGERRVRCCNIVAGVNEGAIETMKFVDQDAVVNIVAKEAVSKMSTHLLREIRANLTSKTVDILSGYRKNFSGSHPPGQLVLPENLKELAMYMLALHKCVALKAGHETSDRRVHSMHMLKTMGLTELALYLYPRIIPVHNLSPEDGFPHATSGHLIVPPSLRASFSKIEDGGVYIVDNGQTILIWLHSRVSPHLLEDLFGPSFNSLQSLSPHLNSLPVLETHLNAQVRNLLQYLSSVRGSKAVSIQLARQGLDGAEYEFARLLVEDRNNEAQSYVDWLVSVHRAIQLELSGQRKKDEGGEGEGMLAGLAQMRPWGVGGGL